MTSSTILFKIFCHRNKYIFDDVRKRIVFVFSRPNQENNFLPHLPFFCTSFTKLDEAKIMPLNIFAIEGTCCMNTFQEQRYFECKREEEGFYSLLFNIKRSMKLIIWILAVISVISPNAVAGKLCVI